MRYPQLAVSFSCALALGACTFDDSFDDLSSDESELVVQNGQNLNGQNLNGQNLNGQNLNTSELGRFVKWINYGGATLNGANLKSVHLEGSELVGKVGKQTRRGIELVGAVFNGKSDDSHTLSLRIYQAFAPPIGDIWRYTVQYQETDGAWYPICTDDGINLFDSVAVDGWWDLHQGAVGDGSKHDNGNRFLFACRDVGAIGKCIDAGYRPWATVNGTQLGEHHEACVRLLRADYCGDSVPHTVDGQLVNLYDEIGVQDDTAPWEPEAEWDPDGARCLSPHNRSIDEVNCYDDLLHDACATGFAAPPPPTNCDNDSDSDSDSDSDEHGGGGGNCDPGDVTLLISETPQDQ